MSRRDDICDRDSTNHSDHKEQFVWTCMSMMGLPDCRNEIEPLPFA